MSHSLKETAAMLGKMSDSTKSLVGLLEENTADFNQHHKNYELLMKQLTSLELPYPEKVVSQVIQAYASLLDMTDKSLIGMREFSRSQLDLVGEMVATTIENAEKKSSGVVVSSTKTPSVHGGELVELEASMKYEYLGFGKHAATQHAQTLSTMLHDDLARKGSSSRVRKINISLGGQVTGEHQILDFFGKAVEMIKYMDFNTEALIQRTQKLADKFFREWAMAPTVERELTLNLCYSPFSVAADFFYTDPFRFRQRDIQGAREEISLGSNVWDLHFFHPEVKLEQYLKYSPYSH